MVPAIRGVNHVTLVVTDLSRSIAFYVENLGFRLRARWKRGAYLDGPVWLCLELGPAVARPDDSHLAFTVDALPALSVPTWKENRSEGASLYLVDPDGHKLELHVGDLVSRLEACREHPYDGMELFE
jgi:glutathione S-transferase